MVVDKKGPLTLEGLELFWEKVMLPWMEKTFVTKEELKDEFEKYDLKMDRRFNEVNERFDLTDGRISSVEHRLTRVETEIISVKNSLRVHRENTEFHLESHAHAIRQLKGVADADKKKYDDDL